MITVALLAGFAGFWIWIVLNDEDGMFRIVPRVLGRHPMTRKWLTCPWCSGAWFAGGLSIAAYHPTPVLTGLTAIAANAVTGLLGSYIQGD